MRMYEATGAGTLLLTDGKNAPVKNFRDDEVAYYDTIEEAIEKADYYLRHEEKRVAIAEKGQQRTLSEYNYENSSRQLLHYFEQYLN
ncbi:MAG: glycosyltransferase family 1 protein [Bacteroidia bacterium]|nr:glycosyltransferase family 1 protein [Bacteroidia bacterium]